MNREAREKARAARAGNLREARRVLWIVLGLNLLVAGAKLSWGLITGAVSMTADGVHSLLDASNNVVGLVVLTYSFQPPDRAHPYGHRKFETFATLGIAVLLFVACFEIGRTAIGHLRSHRVPAVTAASYLIMGGTMAVNILVALYERRAGKRCRSTFVVADAMHTQSDVYSSLSVLVSLVAVRMGLAIVDVLAAFFIVFLIGRAAFQIVRSSFGVLLDAASGESEEIGRVAGAVEGVLGCHLVRARGPADDLHVDLHVLVDRTLTLEKAHAIADDVEAAILERIPGVSDIVVHTEPDNHPPEPDAHP